MDPQGNPVEFVLTKNYFNPDYLFTHGFQSVKNFLSSFFSQQARSIASSLMFFFSLVFLAIITYSIVRMFEIRKKEKKHLEHEIEEYAHHKREYEKHLREQVGGSKNERWSKTLNYLFSQHSSDWKLAIIEADSMLEGLMEQLGFRGDNLGDRLKMANQENFPELTIAWEVHTTRNRIAHEGLAFELSHHEAKRAIALYEQIFHTYGYI